jgi:hypothetical protein
VAVEVNPLQEARLRCRELVARVVQEHRLIQHGHQLHLLVHQTLTPVAAEELGSVSEDRAELAEAVKVLRFQIQQLQEWLALEVAVAADEPEPMLGKQAGRESSSLDTLVKQSAVKVK